MSNHNYLLEVKNGSQLHKALELFHNKPFTQEQATEQLGTVYGAVATKFFTWYSRQFDNLSLLDGVLTYDAPVSVHVHTSIQANIPQSVPTDSGDDDISTDNMRWPGAPPIPRSLGNKFDKPSYFDRLAMMVKAGRHISLEGPPGVGKDTAVVELAAQLRKPLVTIGGDAGFRVRDLVGNTHISNGHSYHEVGDYVAAVTNGWWVLMTEVNAADPSALMYINRQLAAPYVVNLGGKSYPVHPDFRLFVTYNNGLVGTKPLPQSFKDRFYSVKVPFFTDGQLHKRLVAMGMPSPSSDNWTDEKTVQHHNSKTIVAFGTAMWDSHMRGQTRYQITTRRLIDAVELTTHNVDVRQALRDAVIGAIDNPLEVKAAENVLYEVMKAVQ